MQPSIYTVLQERCTKRAHVLVALDEAGRLFGTWTIPNSPEGWASALAWAREQQQQSRRWGIENGGSLGKGFAQFLLAQGELDVREVSPQRTAQYRRRGRTHDKTDQADALAIARLLLAEGVYLPPIQRDDASTELRLLSDHRDNLLVDRTRLINQLHGQMLQLDPGYQERSGTLTRRRGLAYCRDLALPGAEGVAQTRLRIARQLAGQILRLEEEIATITTALRERVRASRTPVLALCGVGDVIAARLIGELGTVPRVHAAAALAALAGVAPVAVSSGGRGGHRLNRGGNRQLNRALHLVALSQRRCDPRAQAYYAKKRAEGKTGRAAMRCLKRRLVDVLYRCLQQVPAGPSAAIASEARRCDVTVVAPPRAAMPPHPGHTSAPADHPGGPILAVAAVL